MKDRFRLTFPKERVADSVVCDVAKRFDITFSIRRANVNAETGWLDLEIKGSDDEIERVVAFLQESGVRVDPVEGDIIAG